MNCDRRNPWGIATAWLVVLASLAIASQADDEYSQAQREKDETIVQTVMRLDGFDLNSSAKAKAAVLRYLSIRPGTTEFLDLVERFEIRELDDQLLAVAIDKPNDTLGVRAARLLLASNQANRFRTSIDAKDEKRAIAAITVLGNTNHAGSLQALKPLIADETKSNAVRVAATSALGASVPGQRVLLRMVQEKKLPETLQFTVANILFGSADTAMRTAAAKHLTLPKAAGSKPLPPVAELTRLKGTIANGAKVFRDKGTCIKCHRVGKEGTEVGPNLSQIGGKLSRTAFFVSILDPSAGISHNYETYSAVLADGNVVNGIKVSATDESVTLKTEKAIVREIPRGDIEELKKQPVSLMPAGLANALTKQELVDLVDYLQTLK